MNDKKIYEILKSTGMTKHDIDKHIRDGVSIYADDEHGRNDYFEECISCLCSEEDVPEMWESLEKTFFDGCYYRIDYVL